MLRNYLLIAVRNLRSSPVISLINGMGLAIGMACCILISLYVIHERSFDQFHEKGDRIYRLNKTVALDTGDEEVHAITSGLMGESITTLYPEVEQSTRVLPWFDDVLLQRDEQTIKVADVLFADANFFSMFDFRLLRGRADRVLADPNTIVLTEEIAVQLFGNEDPIGQVIIGLNDLPYTVTGIIEAPPLNSHLQYKALISWASTEAGESTLNFGWLNNRITQVTYTYLLLSEGADPENVTAQLPAFMQDFLPERASAYRLFLQPLDAIYLESSDILHTRNLITGNARYVDWFTIIAALILLIACINYMNLATARFTRRIKEVGVRKVLGANKNQLSKQFFLESLFLAVVAFVVALLLVQALLPVFNAVTERTLTFSFWANPLLLAGSVALALVTGMIAGSYPSLFLSSLQPIRAIKQTPTKNRTGLSVRRGLVVTQFSASILLIICTAVVIRQLGFMQSQDPGFERDQVIVMPVGLSSIQDQFEPFKTAVLQHPNITFAAGSNSVPGTRESMMSFNLLPEGKAADENWQAYVWRLDDVDLLDTYRMEMQEGRFFSEAFLADLAGGVVINETLARKLGWDDPVGKQLDISGETEGARVIGVMKDFHFESFHHPIESLVLHIAPRYENLSVRVEGGDMAEVLAFLRAQWEAFDSQYPFEYTFLDEAAAKQYDMESQLMNTLAMFSGLAIFIACMGLFGLAAFSTQQRTKEIGIRKAVGASVGNLVHVLSKEFVQLVGIAFLISVPLAYVAMAQWLQGFAFRVELSWWIFVATGVVSLTIAVVTVSYHSIRLALANPVKALRYE